MLGFISHLDRRNCARQCGLCPGLGAKENEEGRQATKEPARNGGAAKQ